MYVSCVHTHLNICKDTVQLKDCRDLLYRKAKGVAGVSNEKENTEQGNDKIEDINEEEELGRA